MCSLWDEHSNFLCILFDSRSPKACGMAQAVSLCSVAVKPWVRSQESHVIFVWGKMALRWALLRVILFYFVSITLPLLHRYRSLSNWPATANETVNFTSLHFTSLHFASLHFTSHHFTALHITSHHFTSLHCTSHHITSLHCTSHHFIHFTALDLTWIHITSLHFTSLSITGNFILFAVWKCMLFVFLMFWMFICNLMR